MGGNNWKKYSMESKEKAANRGSFCDLCGDLAIQRQMMDNFCMMSLFIFKIFFFIEMIVFYLMICDFVIKLFI